ncbi:MAG: formimidoylglutamate deiminase [Nocardioidaceae bacterium]
MTAYWCERAWLEGEGVVEGVVVRVDGTHISTVTRGQAPADATRLAGLTIPGFANCHSHAFHRALRGRTQRERGTFWSWREVMYDVAARLDPDSYYALAKATYQEMALAGITAVGEFHYLHHDRDGSSYDEPNAMGHALVAAARDAGVRLTLLDTCYLSSGFGAPPEGVQVRFTDGDAAQWQERVAALGNRTDPQVVVGAAIHSVRAVPRDQLATVAAAMPEAPLHVHLSEQQAENTACLDRYGCTPTQLLADEGVLDDRLSAVHATHLTSDDIAQLGAARATSCLCPTTERDLADGVGPAPALADAGAGLTLGSDSHAVIDFFEEMRALELDTRLTTQRRGHWRADALLSAATADGHRSLGFADAGRIAAGCWADLVTVDLGSVRTAGTGTTEESLVFAASAADVTSVVSGGVRLDRDSGTVGSDLERAIGDVLEAAGR